MIARVLNFNIWDESTKDLLFEILSIFNLIFFHGHCQISVNKSGCSFFFLSCFPELVLQKIMLSLQIDPANGDYVVKSLKKKNLIN